MWKIGMPNLGHTMESGKVISWLKARGDQVKPGDAIAVVETDKVTVDVEAPAAGEILELLADLDQAVPVGATIAVLGQPHEREAAAQLRLAEAQRTGSPASVEPATDRAPQGQARSAPPVTNFPPGRSPISPVARRRAEELGVDLALVEGTGEGGLIVRTDVERAAARMPAPVITIHGFGASASLFAPMAEAGAIENRMTDLTLPGHDNTALPSGEPKLQSLADALLSHRAFGGEGKLFLIGHSLGAAVAALMARKLGERVLGLVLVSPLGLCDAPDTDFIADFLGAADATRADKALAKLAASPARITSAFREITIRQMSDPAHVARLSAIAQACLASGANAVRIAPVLQAIETPVLIVWGRDDRVMPPPAPAILPPKTDVLFLAEAGHLLPVERPAALASHIAAFLHQHTERRP